MSAPTRISRTGLGYLLEEFTQPPLPLDDETIAAYLVGFLTPNQIAEVEKAIQASPALQEHIAELRLEYDEWASNKDMSEGVSAALRVIHEGAIEELVDPGEVHTADDDAYKLDQTSHPPPKRRPPPKTHPEVSSATPPNPQSKLATRDSAQEFRYTGGGQRVTWRAQHGWAAVAAVLMVLIGIGTFFATRSRHRGGNGQQIIISGHGHEESKATVDREALKSVFSRKVRLLAEGPFSIMAAKDDVIQRVFRDQYLIITHQSGNRYEHPFAAVPLLFQGNSRELFNDASQAILAQLATIINEGGANGAKYAIEVHAGSGEEPQGRKRLAQERARNLESMLKKLGVKPEFIERVEGFDHIGSGAADSIMNTFDLTDREEALVLLVKEQ